MTPYFKIIVFLIFGFAQAQEKLAKSVYFDFDSYKLQKEQKEIITDFIKNSDTLKIESILIYGYCDDRGENDYNYNLSKNRVNTIRDLLVFAHFNQKKIRVLEGKGRVLLKRDTVVNLYEVRSKNRRVDIFVIEKPVLSTAIYSSLREKIRVGDRIFLEKILFNIGSSDLNLKSKNELDKIVLILKENPSLEFEIRGHVCCTPRYYKDAIDEGNQERNLSENRARNVYNYLVNRNINPKRMTYKGFGNKNPQRKGDAYDRRVEFLIKKI